MTYSKHQSVFNVKIKRNVFALNSSSKNSDYTELHCSSGDLLGTFGLFIQVLLALLAFSCLIGIKHAQTFTQIYMYV